MNIINAGYNYKHPSDFLVNRTNGSGDYVFLLLKTSTFFVFNDTKYIANPNSIVIFKKGTPQNYGALSRDFINDWLHFELEKEEEHEITTRGIPFDTVIPIRSSTVFSDLIKSIFFEKYSQNLHKDISMNLYFNLIITKLSEQIKSFDQEKQSHHPEILYDLRNEIQLSPQLDWSIDNVSKKTNLSRSYIQHLYKETFGVSITSDVLQNRIKYAQYLLSSTEYTIYTVSQMCGYANEVHFMRIFKKETGTTPSGYRKIHRISHPELNDSKMRNPHIL